MNTDFAMSQGQLLTAKVIDVQMHGGICHALSWEWCQALLKGAAFNSDSEFFRCVSMQRAYQLTWAEKLQPLLGGAQYAAFLAGAEPPTRTFTAESARRYGRQFAAERAGDTLVNVQTKVEQMAAGTACIITCFGTGIANNKNWGHSMGFGITAAGKAQFFNANSGGYSWDLGTPMATVSADVLQKLYEEFPPAADNVRDCFLYHLS